MGPRCAGRAVVVHVCADGRVDGLVVVAAVWMKTLRLAALLPAPAPSPRDDAPLRRRCQWPPKNKIRTRAHQQRVFVFERVCPGTLW